MNEEKTIVEQLKEELCLDLKNSALIMEDEEIIAADNFSEGYKAFLTQCKTEREATAFAVKAAQDRGFVPFDSKKKYKAG
ncbi:MAG TPA: aminopeptidase, partial [Clostridiales bacterium]|nr:aminopeptidase [Clostridiales bacterium]